jgi:aldehyde:ferredoxin oxidoreductase
MNSLMGKILKIDLSTGKIKTEATPREWIDLYTGQKGLGTRLLMQDFDPRTDPLSPENRLVLSTSVMGGTIVSCSAKLAVVSKSPLTGTISDGSVGGGIGAELKYAGYDAVILSGKANRLSIIYLSPDGVRILETPELKGVGSFDTESRVKETIGDDQTKVLTIGPAGENLVRFACISSERYRQLGRGGLGAVMGSKNLKAVAIRGWLDVHVVDIDRCLQVVSELNEYDAICDPEYEVYEFGTWMLVDPSQEAGLLPTRNFQQGTFADAELLNGESYKAIRKNKKACFSCCIACGNYVETGKHRVEGPEFETIALCGSGIANGDPELLVELNELCDDMGLDTISTGGVLAYMMEMTERGLYDFGLRFGETGKAIERVKEIARGPATGRDAALGSRALAGKFGGRKFAMQIKGMELPGYDPRGSWGMGLAYATAPRGGCHMSTYPIAEEAWGPLDPFTFEGKAGLVAEGQNTQFAKFSMGVCDFWPITAENLGKLFEVTYGGSWPAEKVNLTGERIFNLQRMFNVMAGFDRKDDRLPERFHKEALPDGPAAGIQMSHKEYDKALDEYYALRGWNRAGRPTPEKLRQLGIEEDLIEAYTHGYA